MSSRTDVQLAIIAAIRAISDDVRQLRQIVADMAGVLEKARRPEGGPR